MSAAAQLYVHPGWLGTIPGWLTLIALAVLGWYVVRGSGGQALNVLETANRVLARQVEDDKLKIGELQQRVSELEATRSLTPITEAVTDLITRQAAQADERFSRTVELVAHHEQHAQERHEQQLQMMRELFTGVAETIARAVNGEPAT